MPIVGKMLKNEQLLKTFLDIHLGLNTPSVMTEASLRFWGNAGV